LTAGTFEVLPADQRSLPMELVAAPSTAPASSEEPEPMPAVTPNETNAPNTNRTAFGDIADSFKEIFTPKSVMESSKIIVHETPAIEESTSSTPANKPPANEPPEPDLPESAGAAPDPLPDQLNLINAPTTATSGGPPRRKSLGADAFEFFGSRRVAFDAPSKQGSKLEEPSTSSTVAAEESSFGQRVRALRRWKLLRAVAFVAVAPVMMVRGIGRHCARSLDSLSAMLDGEDAHDVD